MTTILVSQPPPAPKALIFPLDISGYPVNSDHIALFNKMPDGSWKQNGDLPALNFGHLTLTRANWGQNSVVKAKIEFFNMQGILLDESQEFDVTTPAYPNCGIATNITKSYSNGNLSLAWQDSQPFPDQPAHTSSWNVHISDLTAGTPEEKVVVTAPAAVIPVTEGHTYRFYISTVCGDQNGTDCFPDEITCTTVATPPPAPAPAPTTAKGGKKK